MLIGLSPAMRTSSSIFRRLGTSKQFDSRVGNRSSMLSSQNVDCYCEFLCPNGSSRKRDVAKIRSFSSSLSSSSSLYASKKHLSIRLYRILYRCIQDDSDLSPFESMLLQPPLDIHQLGYARTRRNTNSRLLWNDSRRSNSHKDDIRISEEENEQRWKNILKFFRQHSSSPQSRSEYFPEDDDEEDFLWVTNHDLKCALRHAFLERNENNNEAVLKSQKEAIDAVKIWNQQIDTWKNYTTVTVDESYGIRVVATSCCYGQSGASGNRKINKHSHHFAYKIRVQSLKPPQQQRNKMEDDELVVQLLGRTWIIKEEKPVSSSIFDTESDDDDYITDSENEVISIRSPTTGAVGHLPVIRPGETFEYMSKCELATAKGSMGGCFHMALVPPDTKSAQVGDPVSALQDETTEKFEMPVGPFNLSVP